MTFTLKNKDYFPGKLNVIAAYFVKEKSSLDSFTAAHKSTGTCAVHYCPNIQAAVNKFS